MWNVETGTGSGCEDSGAEGEEDREGRERRGEEDSGCGESGGKEDGRGRAEDAQARGESGKAGEEATEKAREEEQWEIEHYAEGTLELVNEARVEEGLPALTLDPDLVEAAEIRARELSEYFSHTRPDGSQAYDVIKACGGIYFYDGENIAKGGAISSTIQGWMSSSGHRETIMGKKYQYYGAAAYRDENGSTFFVQLFGGN